MQGSFTENFTENEKKIIYLLKNDNKITTNEMSSKLGLSRRTIQTLINSLKSKGILIRVGSDKKGYWEIIKEDKN